MSIESWIKKPKVQKILPRPLLQWRGFFIDSFKGRAGQDILLIFVPKFSVLDHSSIVKSFRDKGSVVIQEGNSKKIKLLRPELWTEDMGQDWVYLLFDIFQIRSICEPFSEVSLDIVEFASKPTIYHSPANKIISKAPKTNCNLKFALIREPNWNKLLFQISQPILAKEGDWKEIDFKTNVFYPLLMTGTKEMFLGPEGDVKIIKG